MSTVIKLKLSCQHINEQPKIEPSSINNKILSPCLKSSNNNRYKDYKIITTIYILKSVISINTNNEHYRL